MLLVVLAATVSACSFKTYYNRIDELIAEYVEAKVSLDDVLEQTLAHRSELLLKWHRNTQLKDYAHWLRGVQRDVGPHTTIAIVDRRTGELIQFWRSIETKLNAEMAELLPLLDARQRQELFANIEKDNQTYRAENLELSERERIKQYEKNLRENYENWIGGLNRKQRKIVRRAARDLVSTADLRIPHRYEWQGGIQAILASDATRAVKSRRLLKFLNEFKGSNDVVLDKRTDINRRVLVRLTVDLAHSLTEKQRAFFITKTDDYIRMFNELAENR